GKRIISMDLNFPIITYEANLSLEQNGLHHGEQFREAIKELAEIREELMLSKSPHLKSHLERLAEEQLEVNQKYMPKLNDEMLAIAKGANLSNKEIVILNNYTDFRDIELPDEGCSTVYMKTEKSSWSGQTWDMHRSAKRFLCLIHIKQNETESEKLVLSLAGCLGLMGMNSLGCLVGVNNINTTDAKPGAIWPCLVRECLYQSNLDGMIETLTTVPVTSGHNYIISDKSGGAHYEITPTLKKKVSMLRSETGAIFHTNHCLHPEVKKIESTLAQNSTTHLREELLEKKLPYVKSFKDFENVFRDHEGYPKSICSHFESGAQDPSFTCGAGVVDYDTDHYVFWRGCKEHDENYVEHRFDLKEGSFIEVS
ncbi:MAG: C45 family autoproteolytic acyltransferase/hydrolase, partial [Bacteriovoracaceae bacterium]